MTTAKPSFKFNWGWGIFLFFTSFVGFMIFMVYLTTTIDHDLVTTDYYKQEIEYQNKIDMKSNLARSGQHVSVVGNKKEVLINIPKIKSDVIEEAEVYFYRASDETKDIKLKEHVNGTFIVSNDKLVKGEYIIKTEWKDNGVKYYEEINYTHL